MEGLFSHGRSFNSNVAGHSLRHCHAAVVRALSNPLRAALPRKTRRQVIDSVVRHGGGGRRGRDRELRDESDGCHQDAAADESRALRGIHSSVCETDVARRRGAGLFAGQRPPALAQGAGQWLLFLVL